MRSYLQPWLGKAGIPFFCRTTKICIVWRRQVITETSVLFISSGHLFSIIYFDRINCGRLYPNSYNLTVVANFNTLLIQSKVRSHLPYSQSCFSTVCGTSSFFLGYSRFRSMLLCVIHFASSRLL